jgi:spore maturation protein CgeB
MNFLYIGQNNPGSTSGMRALTLKKIIQPEKFAIIDTSIPFIQTFKLFRSLGFRYNFGPLITNINHYIVDHINCNHYDFIWVDKAAFISPETTRILHKKTQLLVHYTPDCALYSNRSHLFEKSIPFYNWLITTKSFERNFYPPEKLIYVTQSYNKNIHQPVFDFEHKYRDVSFIGLYEKSRGEVVKILLDAGIKVTLGGVNWKHFGGINHPNVEYLGEKIFGRDYAEVISSSKFSLGLLSKKFPELHTTRTFEIPACGTALITEKNQETTSFFQSDEVIFYEHFNEIPDKILHFQTNLKLLKNITQKGYERMTTCRFDNEAILQNILQYIKQKNHSIS